MIYKSYFNTQYNLLLSARTYVILPIITFFKKLFKVFEYQG